MGWSLSTHAVVLQRKVTLMANSEPTRRQFLHLGAAAGAAALGGGIVSSPGAAGACAPKPKKSGEEATPYDRQYILFIAIDDLRHDCGCWGHPMVRTPNIDRLASRGTRFDRSYCQYPVCNPSRSSFLTGLRPDTTQVLGNRTPLRSKLPDVVTLPQLFRQNGYFTARLGKIFHGKFDDARSWDVSTDFRSTPTGQKGEGRNLTGGRLRWCAWRAADGRDEDQPDGQLAAGAIRLLEQDRDRPFFIGLGFHKPHDPFVAPKRYFDLYPLLRMQPPETPPDATPASEPAFSRGFAQAFATFTDRDRREFMRAYYACTTFMDAQLGNVLDALDRFGLAESTVIVFLSDHGYHLGERGWWNKNTLFEHSCRSPLIVRAPGIGMPGQATQRLVEFVDIYPTLGELCGLPTPEGLEGRSFVPLLREPDRPWKQAAFTQVERGTFAGYTVRTQRWRYTEWDGGKQGVELYDHDSDPGEWHNLAEEPARASVRAHLSGHLHTYAHRKG